MVNVMDKRISLRIFIGLIVIYAVLSGISVFLPAGDIVPVSTAKMPAPLPVVALMAAAVVLVIYGAFGLVGFFLARKLGLPEVWDSQVTNRQRFLVPALVGIVVGIIIIVGDLIFRSINSIGPFPHPPFPTSVVAAITAGIGEETIFRLFFISFWTWLVSRVILRGRAQAPIYWIVSIFSAIAFGIGHLPSLMVLYGWNSVEQVPPMLLTEILLLNGIMGLAAAYLLRKVGFLGSVGVHMWADVVWHVIWGAL